MLWYCQPPAYHMSTDGDQPFSRDWVPHLRSGEPSGGYLQFAELDFSSTTPPNLFLFLPGHITLLHYEFLFLMLSQKGQWQSWGDRV